MTGSGYGPVILDRTKIHIRLTNVIIDRESSTPNTRYEYYYPRLCNDNDFDTEWE